MKNLIILFVILLQVHILKAQFVNDTLAGLPYDVNYYNDFESNITGWTQVNGGAVIHDAGTGSLIITNGTGGTKGGYLSGYDNEFSEPYRLNVRIDSVSDDLIGLIVMNRWAIRVDTLYGTGWHTIQFVSAPDAGTFSNHLVLQPYSASGPDSVWIGFMDYGKINDHRDTWSKFESQDSVNTIVRKAGKIYGNDFEYDVDGVEEFSITGPTSPVNGAYRLSLLESGDIACFGANLFEDTMAFEVYIDITIVDNPVSVYSVWGSSRASPIVTISESGTYTFNMFRRGPQATSNLDGLCIRPSGSTAVLQVEDIIIRPIDYNPSQHQYWVELGSGAQVTSKLNPGSNELNDGSISIGYSSNVDGEGIAIGDSAIAKLDATYGTTGGDDMLAIGNRAKSYGWRNMAIGSRAHAAGQSSVALGTGAVALMSHSIALGRGSFLGNYNSETANTLNTDATILYLSNGWAHQFDTPLSGIAIGNDATPSNVEVKIYAQDAYDSRAVPSSFNVAAGHLGLYAGRGTGTGEGGELRFYTAPQAGVGQNVKNNPVLSGKFDSDASISDGTDLWLLDRSDDTMKRVKVKEPTGSGSNKIIGFSRLYIE